MFGHQKYRHRAHRPDSLREQGVPDEQSARPKQWRSVQDQVADIRKRLMISNDPRRCQLSTRLGL
jgi:hypothetical protein